MLKRAIRLVVAVSCLMQAALVPAQAADVKRFMDMCNGQMCPWFLADIPVPAGWASDEEFGRANKMLVLLPKKQKLQASDPMIYVRTTYNGDNRTLDVQAANSNKRWQDMAGSVTIERLPDVERGEGKGVWQVYRYNNIDKPTQAHELLAFGEHIEKENQNFFYMVVVTASERSSIDKAQPVWRDLLGNL